MKRIVVETDLPGRGFILKKQSAKVGILYTPHNKQVVLWEGVPLAVWDGNVLYVHTSVAGVKLAVFRKTYPNAAEMTFHTVEFEFILGQVLSQAGLTLVRKKEE